jgi:VanZ family protein
MTKYLPSILVCTLVLILSVINTGVLPKTNIPSADKIVHTAMYIGITMILMLDQTSYMKSSITQKQIGFTLVFATCYGVSMEGIQSILPWRSGSIYDIIANTLGVVLGVGLFLLINKLKHK